jgi:peptide/nickel transport system permease protein
MRARTVVKAVLRRLIGLVLVLLLVTLGTSLFLQLIPGGPADVIAGAQATPEQVQAVTESLHLDKPFLEQYGDWLGGALHGDLGRSYATQQPVLDVVRDRLPVTVELAVLALIMALVLAIPAGIWSAYRNGKWFDRLLTVTASGVLAIPGFVLALALVYFLAIGTGTFPVTGWADIGDGLGENLRYAFLPALSLALPLAALFARLLRNDMTATLQEEFITSARARGLSTRRVLLRHALQPSAFSLLTVMGVAMGQLIGGTVIVETVFSLPGVGQLAINSINNRDYLMLRGIVLVLSIAYVAINTLVDLAYPLLDPRVAAGR